MTEDGAFHILEELELVSVEVERSQEDPINEFTSQRETVTYGDGIFTVVISDRTRVNCPKLEFGKFHLNKGKQQPFFFFFFFHVMDVGH